jgi:subtilisin family serine protease
MKKVTFLGIFISVSACTPHLGSNNGTNTSAAILAPQPEVKKRTAVENEFVFKGDQHVVQKTLQENGISAKIEHVSLVSTSNKFRVKYEGSASFATLKKQLADKVEWMEPNYLVNLVSSKNRHDWPTNRLFFKQWGLNNLGQSPPFGLPGTEGADMDILKAWTLSRGSKDIIVAVIDTGVDYTHPGLKDNMWVNQKEAPTNGGVAGVDDDANGYVDDIYGFDFVSADKSSLWHGVPGGPDPMDKNGHGTFCAGEIGAIPNTNFGTAGVNWNVRIMAARFLDGEGRGSNVDAVRAIEYARLNHADIMSNSWGGGDTSELLQEEITESAKAGILFVVAAGNDGKDIDVKPDYPASIKTDSAHRPLENVLTVGASDNQDNPASFSNFGSQTVDVFAPGVEIVSTYPQSLLPEGADPYAEMSGTSMATPYTAGVAALMMAYDSGFRHHPDRVIAAIQKTADVKASLVGKAISNGRINAYKAMTNSGQNPVIAANWLDSGKTLSQRAFHEELVDIRNEVKVDNASALRLHFNWVQIDHPYDSIYIYDKDYRLITEIGKAEANDYWSPIIPGDTAHVRFVNSLVKTVTMQPSQGEPDEEECLSEGGSVLPSTDAVKISCQVDKQSTDDSDSKPTSSNNSGGYTVDRVEYVSAKAGGN